MRACVAGLLVALSVGLTGPAAASDCGGAERPCTVGTGRYYAAPPPGWDGESPLPAVIFFHGYRSSGANAIANDALRQAVHAAGYLLVAPDGLAGTWAHVGSPSDRRDEMAFMDDVRADLMARWRVDSDRLLVTGFSQGGSMVWDLACYRGDAYTTFAPISGAFWQPLPDHCPGGPVTLRHVHGTADTVVPMAGRAIRETFRQGDVREGFALWRRHDGCAATPDRKINLGELRCQVWTDCDGGALQLCLHDGGHRFRAAWVAEAIDWMEHLGHDALR